MVLTKFVLKYIFVKLKDPEKDTEFRFLLGLPTGIGLHISYVNIVKE